MLSLSRLAIAAFVAYISYVVYTMYSIFQLPACTERGQCLRPYVNKNPKLAIEVSVSHQKRISSSLKTIWTNRNFTLDEVTENLVTVNVPKIVRNNGTLYVHSFLHVLGEDPHSSYLSHDVSPITTYALPQSSFVNLLGNGGQEVNGTKQESKTKPSSATKSKSNMVKPHSHWRQRLHVCVMGEKDLLIDRKQVPQEIYQYLRLDSDGSYLPIIYIDEIGYRLKDLLPLNESSAQMPLTISYSPISMGKLRLWIHISQSFSMLKGLGFTEKDTDEVKGIFADTNFYFLTLTFFVAAFHMLFDFLAFKNDISYWKARKSMVGLSSRVVIWRCISTTIIFLYLMDEETSLLVLVPAGIGTLIEVWKVTKAFKVKVEMNGFVPKLRFGTSSDQEKETQEFDSQAMKYLSYVLYPLCLGGAVYSLIYVKHKSWYSWCINSLVNGVYAFGFLFMMPQLFVNYKMKSVAHLPWRAFMYKAFNTFIDDIFAFIITMPTAHRLACFRDDIIFLVYLYQRWLYPVDKKRANEFGQTFEDEQEKEEEPKQRQTQKEQQRSNPNEKNKSQPQQIENKDGNQKAQNGKQKQKDKDDGDKGDEDEEAAEKQNCEKGEKEKKEKNQREEGENTQNSENEEEEDEDIDVCEEEETEDDDIDDNSDDVGDRDIENEELYHGEEDKENLPLLRHNQQQQKQQEAKEHSQESEEESKKER